MSDEMTEVDNDEILDMVSETIQTVVNSYLTKCRDGTPLPAAAIALIGIAEVLKQTGEAWIDLSVDATDVKRVIREARKAGTASAKALVPEIMKHIEMIDDESDNPDPFGVQ